MNRIGNLFMAAALAVLPMACKDDTRKEADKAAEAVKDQREDLADHAKDLKEAVADQQENVAEGTTADTGMGRRANGEQAERNANQIADESKAIAENVGELKTAESTFDLKRFNRTSQLRLVQGVIATQPMLINALTGVTALTDKARTELAEKMQTFQMRIDETGNAIEALQTTDAASFEERNDAAAKAMDRLDDAREAAWDALNDGDRIEAS